MLSFTKKLVVLCSFIIVTTPSAYSSGCEEIAGQWFGEQIIRRSLWTCEWDVHAIITRDQANTIYIQYNLSNPNHKFICRGYKLNYEMKGQCMASSNEAELWFDGMRYAGKLQDNNHIILNAPGDSSNYPSRIVIHKTSG